jgi:hypothetical protein
MNATARHPSADLIRIKTLACFLRKSCSVLGRSGWLFDGVLKGAMLAVLIALSGCGRISWKEEVQLGSSEVIVVQRTAKAESFGEIGGPGGWENRGMTVEIVQPEMSDKPPIWDFPFVPLVFDRDRRTGEWFMVATFYSCTSWYDLGRPRLPYVEYRLQQGKWVAQALSRELIGREANMLTSIRSSGEDDHTLASKRAILRDPTIALEYRRIVGTWSTTC